MEYKIVVKYNQMDFIGFTKAWEYQSKPLRVLRIISKALFIIAGGFLLLLGGISVIQFIWGLIVGNSVLPLSYIPLPIAFIIIGLLLLTRSDYKRMGKLLWKKYNEKGSEIIYNFYEGYFTEHMAASEHKFDYSIIKSIYEDKLRYYLFVDKSVAHIINKAGFEVGNSEQFAAFISKQVGQGVNQIK